MKNTYPNKLEFINIMAGYTQLYVSHSAPVDYDILGKSMWITNLATSTTRRVILTDTTSVFKNYFTVNSLSQGVTYRIQAAFYDSMIDSQLLEAKIGYQLSNTVDITMKTPPTITAYTVTATPVEIGVSLPLISFTISGDGDTIQVQYRKVGDTTWAGFYEGGSGISPTSTLMPGTYEFRIRGLYLLPDGVTQDFSNWYQYPTSITVDYQQIPPSAPSGLTYKVAEINDSFLRYDVKVSWDWVRGTGAPIREFIVYYTTATDYAANGWNKAQIINTGATQYCILNNFPFNIAYKLKVVSRAWGLEDYAYATSPIIDLVINSSTVFDNSFTKLTGIDVNYSGIFGYLDPTGTRTQTFKLDAGTGAVQIGTPDATTGIVPFSFDPINKKLNVDGSVITNSIYSANFILANLTGTPPVLRSQEKLSYGDANHGLWAGYAGTAFKFDLGNSSQYVRWDGTTLRISGNVVIGTPSGDLSLTSGLEATNTVFIYKSSSTVPTTPSSTVYPPSGWSTTPPSVVSGQHCYVSQGKIDVLTNTLKTGEVWSPPVQFTGQDGATGAPGANGQRGPGTYMLGIAWFSTWLDNNANSFFYTTFGTGPVLYDVLTEYNTSNVATAVTRMWNGSSWVNPALVVHGDMIATGTIRAEKMVADVAFFQKAGINQIYNNAAAISGNPEGTYTMKIDLANGFIHIR